VTALFKPALAVGTELARPAWTHSQTAQLSPLSHAGGACCTLAVRGTSSPSLQVHHQAEGTVDNGLSVHTGWTPCPGQTCVPGKSAADL